jgi:hypothetical protein
MAKAKAHPVMKRKRWRVPDDRNPPQSTDEESAIDAQANSASLFHSSRDDAQTMLGMKDAMRKRYPRNRTVSLAEMISL